MLITEAPEWAALTEHHRGIAGRHLRDLFAEDPRRGATLACSAGDLYLDYSKNRLTAETVRLLAALAERAGLRERTEAMFRGEHINTTEDRAVLHVALRMPRDGGLIVDGQDVAGDVHRVLDRMADFADRVRSGAWTGHTGERIRTVVNIGIGGVHPSGGVGHQRVRPVGSRAGQGARRAAHAQTADRRGSPLRLGLVDEHADPAVAGATRPPSLS
jgi:glucose-6-phosphate isomerase